MKSNVHRISIPSILSIGSNIIGNIGILLEREKFCKVAVFFDEEIKKLFGNPVLMALEDKNIHYEEEIFDSMDYSDITEKAFKISNEVQALVALGGGKVLDAVKYMGFLRKLPFISIPTSTSNDGFSSPVSSLLIKGRRTTVPAHVPYGIVLDTDIISSAPIKFVYSGIGDIVSNLTALWDWKFEEDHKKIRRDDYAVMIAQKAANSFMHISFRNIQEKPFIANMVDSLTMNGIAMEISGSSAPASGSEHLISHALDKIQDKPFLHGIQVGIATYLMSQIQNNQPEEIKSLFQSTGFFEFAGTLGIKKNDFLKAIDLAPAIKPQRYTSIHIEKNRAYAKELISKDIILKSLLK